MKPVLRRVSLELHCAPRMPKTHRVKMTAYPSLRSFVPNKRMITHGLQTDKVTPLFSLRSSITVSRRSHSHTPPVSYVHKNNEDLLYKQIMQAIQTKDRKQVETLWNNYKLLSLNLPEQLQRSLILFYHEIRDVDKLISLLDDIKKCGTQLTLLCYEKIFSTLNTADVKVVVSWLDKLKADGISPTLNTFNSILEPFVKSEKLDEFLKWLHSGPSIATFWPNRVAFNMIIDSYAKKGDVTAVSTWLEQMLACGIQPDLLTYNSVLLAYGKSKNINDMLHWFELLKASEFQPNEVTFNLILSAFGTAGKLEDVAHWFEEMKKSGITPSTLTYTILINACAQQGNSAQLRKWLHELKEAKLQMDLVVLNSLLEYFAKAKDFSGMWLLFNTMKTSGLEPDVVTFTSFINVFGRAQQFEEMRQCFASMQEFGVQPDVTVFNSIIASYAKAELLQEMHNWFHKMKKYKVTPDGTTYHMFVSYYLKHNKLAEAAKWMKLLVADPNAAQSAKLDAYNQVLAAYGKLKQVNVSTVVTLFNSMQQHGLSPNTDSFNTMLSTCGRAGKLTDMWHYYHQMKASGVLPNHQTFKSLILTCVKRNAVTHVVECVHEMKALGFKDTEIWSLLDTLPQHRTLHVKHFHDILNSHSLLHQ